MNHETSASLFVLLAAAIGIMLLIWIIPAKALECAERPDGKSYWSYRIVDGQRCWFRGHRRLPKSSLEWPDEPKPKKIKGDPVFNAIRAEALPKPKTEAPLQSNEPMRIVEDGCCWPKLTEFDLRWAGVQP